MNIITGGVTAPKGFKAAGLHCGVKDNFTTPQPDKKDLAMVLSSVPCAAAGTYTRNVVKADPVILTMKHLADHKAQGVILDSGNANACAPKGMENAVRMANAAAAATGLQPEDFAVCSTGIIGVELNIDAIEKGIPPLVAALSDSEQASSDAAGAITAKANMLFLVGVYFIHTCGELCLSPVGLSFVTKLSPKRMVSLMMGVWLLSSAIANYFAGNLEAMLKTYEVPLFLFLIVSSFGAAAVLFVVAFGLKKWTKGY